MAQQVNSDKAGGMGMQVNKPTDTDANRQMLKWAITEKQSGQPASLNAIRLWTTLMLQVVVLMLILTWISTW